KVRTTLTVWESLAPQRSGRTVIQVLIENGSLQLSVLVLVVGSCGRLLSSRDNLCKYSGFRRIIYLTGITPTQRMAGHPTSMVLTGLIASSYQRQRRDRQRKRGCLFAMAMALTRPLRSC